MSRRLALVPTLALLAAGLAAADQQPPATDTLVVVGTSQADAQRLPGTATVLDAPLLETHHYDSVHQRLRLVPGATVVDEDGYSVRANIGMRGVNPVRSNKVHVLEDGVPIAPNPYNDPSLYVGPAYARYTAVEVIKGSGQILYGPHTVAGVVNFKSEPLAYAAHGAVDAAYGTQDMARARVAIEVPLGDGLTAALDAYTMDTTGFRPYDDINLDEVVARFGWRPSDSHRLEAKLFSGAENSNLTYLGQAAADYAADAYGRYDFTKTDTMEASRRGIHLRHRWDLSASAHLVSTAYTQEVERAWNRHEFTFDGTSFVGSTATTAGFTRDRSERDRAYRMRGAEVRLHAEVAGAVALVLDAGARVHGEDQVNRNVDHQTSTGTVRVRDSITRDTVALAGWIQTDIEPFEGLHLIPGVRVEHLDITSERTIAAYAPASDPAGTSSLSEVLPGFGTTWDLGGGVSLYGGVHRGFSPPAYSQAITPTGEDNKLDAETSWNYEVGVRMHRGPALEVDLAAFWIDWDNIIAQGVSGGPQVNGGESAHYGAELQVSSDLGQAAGLAVGIPVRLAATHVTATYESDVYSGTTLVAKAGNDREYAPELTVSASLGVTGIGPRQGFEAHLTGTYVGEQFSDGLNTEAVSPRADIGRLDAFTTLDATVKWKPSDANYEIYATARNILDEEYVAYRRGGHGAFAGAPVTALLGVAARF